MAFKPAKRSRDDDKKAQPKHRVKKQKRYHSSSEEESEDEVTFKARDAPKPILKQPPQPDPQVESEDEDDDEDTQLAINTALNSGTALNEDEDAEEEGTEDEWQPKAGAEDDDDDDEEVDDDLDDEGTSSESETSMTSSQAARSKKKRNDPEAFATSISKILDTKLSTSKRSDPVLSRSKSAADANKTLANDRLEAKARAQIRSERKAALEKGRVKDVLGVEDETVDSGAIVEAEKRLKKTAQRGVVKLFNAVRAAQVKAEEAMKQARSEGVVGMRQREEKVNEMSKQGFLDLISSGGK